MKWLGLAIVIGAVILAALPVAADQTFSHVPTATYGVS